MMKILLIDDEKPTRMVLRHLLEKSQIDYFQIFEAKNGEEGYQIFRNECPDILILDINMPHMNGIQFLEKIEKYIGNTKVIILSGYDEFQFAQKAIQYHVIAYLLKPINREELFKAIQRAKDDIEKEMIARARLNIEDRYRKIDFLRNIVRGEKNSVDIRYQRELQELSEFDSFMICILRWNFDNIEDEDLKKIYRTTQDENSVSLCIEQYFSREYKTVCFTTNRDETLLFVYGYKDIECLKENLRLLKRWFWNMYGTLLWAVCGEGVDTPERIREAYRTARKKLGNKKILDQKQSEKTIFADKTEPQAGRKGNFKNLIASYKKAIQNSFMENDRFKLQGILTDIFEQMKNQSYCTVDEAELILQQFIVMIDEWYLSEDNDNLFVRHRISWHQKMNHICNFDDFRRLMFLIADETMSDAQGRKNSLKRTISEIKYQIDTDYVHDLSLSALEEKYHFSKQYLNRSFRMEYECSIHEYLLQVRMEKARYLLENTEMSVNEIGNSVGYEDQGYFGKVFRRYFHQSPKSFRERTNFEN